MAQADLFNDLTQGTGVWKEALDNSVLSMRQLKEIQAEISEQQMNIGENKREILKSDYKGANIMKRMVSSGGKLLKQTEKVRNAKRAITDTENDLIAIQKKIYKARKLGKPGEDVVTSLKKQYNATQIQNQKAKIGLKQMRQTIPVLGKLSAMGGKTGAIADGIIDGIGSIVGAIPIIGSIINGLLTIGKTIIGVFLAPLKAAFGVFLEMQSAVGNLSADIGLTAIESKVLMNNMVGLTLSAMKFGGSMKDVVTVMQQFSEITGKNMMFNEAQIGKIVELGLGTGLGVDAASEMAASFENMGISLEKTINLTDKARGLAARYNVNTTKVLKTYDGLVKSLTGIGFGKGLENLTKLAAKATAIRFDIVASTKAFADAFFDPEKAVEAAARMQTLGGKFAASFGDPMQLAFESMNDPTALAEKFAATVSEIVKKDSKGNYFIPPEERKSLKIAAETLGQNYEDAVQTAVEQRKIADKMAMLQKSGFNLMQIDEADRPALANLISLNEKGQYTIRNSAGVEDLLANMTDKNGLKAILDSRKKNEAAAIGRKNMMERLEMIYDRFIMGFSNIFTKLFGSQDFDSFLAMVEKAGTSLAKFISEDIMGSEGLTEGFKKVINWAKGIFEKISAIWADKDGFLKNVGQTLKVLFTDVLVAVLKGIMPFLKIGIATIMEGISHALPDALGGKKMRDSAMRMKQEAIKSDKTGALAAMYKGSGIQEQMLPPEDGTKTAGEGLLKYGKAGKGALNLAKMSGGIATKVGGKGLSMVGNALMKKSGAGAVGKLGTIGFNMAEAGAKMSGKTILKHIPILGTLVSLGFAVKDAMEGDWAGAGLQVASGAAGLLDLVAPGVGTTASIAIDAADAAREMGYFDDGQIAINSNGNLYTGNFGKGDMVQFIHEKAAKDAMSNIGDSDKSGNLNTTSFKTNIDQFINEKTIQEAMTTMFKSMDSGMSTGTSSVVRHEGSIKVESQDGRYMTYDVFHGSADRTASRILGILETNKNGAGNYMSGTNDPIIPIYA